MEQENLHMKQHIEILTQRIVELEEHLKKYTNSTRHLKYYENNFLDEYNILFHSPYYYNTYYL